MAGLIAGAGAGGGLGSALGSMGTQMGAGFGSLIGGGNLGDILKSMSQSRNDALAGQDIFSSMKFGFENSPAFSPNMKPTSPYQKDQGITRNPDVYSTQYYGYKQPTERSQMPGPQQYPINRLQDPSILYYTNDPGSPFYGYTQQTASRALGNAGLPSEWSSVLGRTAGQETPPVTLTFNPYAGTYTPWGSWSDMFYNF